MADIKIRARFDFIRYASCWEDADILLDALRIGSGDNCFSIGSAGDNSLAMLAKDPAMVVAVDFNPAQHANIELKIQAFKHFSFDEVLGFLGIDECECSQRLKMYDLIKSGLSYYTHSFWERHRELIEEGIVHVGKFERFFYIFRTKIVPLMHNCGTVRQFLEQKSIQDQHEFYERIWDNFRWKLLFRIFFSKFMVGRLGRDPEFFKYVDADVAGSFKKKADHNFTEIPIYTNPYTNYIFSGNFPRHALPFYLRKENFELIKSRIDRLKLHLGDINSCIDRYPDVKFDVFNLSDIFEYMSMQEFLDELTYLLKGATKGSRFAFWHLLVDRFFPEKFPIVYEKELSDKLTSEDKAPFYKRFVVGSNR